MSPGAGITVLSSLVLFVAVLVSSAFPVSAETRAPRILVLVESDSRLPLGRRLLAGIEEALGPKVTLEGELYVQHLDMLRFNDPVAVGHMRAFLAARFGGEGLDAVIVLGQNALELLLANRDAIAPGAPIVFGGISANIMAPGDGIALAPNVTGVSSVYDASSTLALAARMQPEAPEIVVVSGTAQYDSQLKEAVQRLIGADYNGTPVRYVAVQSVPQFLTEAAGLDPQSIVLLLIVNRDAEGRKFLPVDFARQLAAVSAAPVWTLFETQIGVGPVGGSVEDNIQTGRAIGGMAAMALAGEPLPPPAQVETFPTVDWRAVSKHGLNPDLLPEGTRVLFHDPTIWERYRLHILLVAAIIVAQGITIAALLVTRKRHLRTQETLASERAQLVHVSRNMRLGQLSAGLAHEINQPLAAIQANAEAGTRLAGRIPPDVGELQSIFGDITEDTRRAAGIIRNLRRLMVKNETEFEDVELNGIVRATLALAANELDARGASVTQTLSPERLTVRGNGSQLQQIVLNLAINAADAMRELPTGSRIVRVGTSALPDGSRRLIFEDSGPGIPTDQREEVFKPFVGTKSDGLGVGLSICRNIASAHGGTLAFEEPDGAGARAVLTLPPHGVAA